MGKEFCHMVLLLYIYFFIYIFIYVILPITLKFVNFDLIGRVFDHDQIRKPNKIREFIQIINISVS
jgi:hypothetical protein